VAAALVSKHQRMRQALRKPAGRFVLLETTQTLNLCSSASNVLGLRQPLLGPVLRPEANKQLLQATATNAATLLQASMRLPHAAAMAGAAAEEVMITSRMSATGLVAAAGTNLPQRALPSGGLARLLALSPAVWGALAAQQSALVRLHMVQGLQLSPSVDRAAGARPGRQQGSSSSSNSSSKLCTVLQ
jgi:hypothetical protein